MPDPPAVSAQVPATPPFIQVLRNVAAGVAARLDMPIDEIEELRLAVTEAASLLIDESTPASLRLSVARRANGVGVRISSDGMVDPWPSERALGSWPWMVVKGLTDAVALERDDDGSPSVAFSKHTGRVAR